MYCTLLSQGKQLFEGSFLWLLFGGLQEFDEEIGSPFLEKIGTILNCGRDSID